MIGHSLNIITRDQLNALAFVGRKEKKRMGEDYNTNSNGYK